MDSVLVIVLFGIFGLGLVLAFQGIVGKDIQRSAWESSSSSASCPEPGVTVVVCGSGCHEVSSSRSMGRRPAM
jgi:hypothetical protein